jgi:hypothetical protein
VFRVQGALPNMVICSKIIRQTGKKERKRKMTPIVGDDVW